MILWRVSGAMLAPPVNARETADCETPATRATSDAVGGRGPPPSRLLRDVCVPFFVDVIRKLSHVQVGNGAEDKRVLSGEQGDCADSASPIAVQSSEVMGWIV